MKKPSDCFDLIFFSGKVGWSGLVNAKSGLVKII